MNRTDLLLQALTINEQQRLGLSAHRIQQLITQHTTRPRGRRTTNYPDPTGTQAAAAADRAMKERRPR